MKRLFISFLASTCLSLILISCSAPRPTPTASPAPLPDIFTTPWEDLSLFKSGLVQSQQSVLSELTNASVYHLEFNIAEDLYHVTGAEEVRYTNAETVPLNEVQLRLFPNILGGEMTVTDVKIDEKSVTPKYGLENSLLIVPFAKPLEPNQSLILSMDFAVTVPQSVELNYGVLAYFDDVLALAHAYPMFSVYDDEGWNAEIPQNYGDVTYTDASFYIVKVTAPKDLTLVVTGQTISSEETGQGQALIIADGPARDFYLAASPDYEEISQTLGGITIRSYAPKAIEEGAKMALEIAAKSIELFKAHYSPYPYTELDIVATPTLAGGIEYPGLIVVTSRSYHGESDNAGPSSKQMLEGIVAHEVGHQWFYNLVGDDQLDDPWLDEALAQYLNFQYYAAQYGPRGEEGFRSYLEARWHSVDRAMLPIGLPVAKYSPEEYSAIVYSRGPLFFVALKEEMGTEAFEAFLKNYTETLSWKISTPETLQSLAEKHCACDLQKIFDEWVYP
jgi:peptidase M1-like protein